MTEDWRLQGQERFLIGATLSRKKYKKYRSDWEHDHCEFCSKKFSEQPDDTNEGYVTPDGYHWICDECFADFKDRFKWKVVGNNEDGG
jgi:hypothetical protein